MILLQSLLSIPLLFLLLLPSPGLTQLHATSKCQEVDHDLPNWWCDEAISFCVSLDNSTTAICCEWTTSNDCQILEPVPCDMSLYDPDKNVSGKIRTTRTNDKFGRCGSQCCPFGYTCSEETRCVMIVEQAVYGNPLDLARGKCTSHCTEGDSCCYANCITPDINPCAASTFGTKTTSTARSSSLSSSSASLTQLSMSSLSLDGVPIATDPVQHTQAAASSISSAPTPSPTTSSTSSSPAAGMHDRLIGGLVGGILSAAILGLVAFLLWRRRSSRSNRKPQEDKEEKGKEQATMRMPMPRYDTPPNQIITPSASEEHHAANGTHTRDFAMSPVAEMGGAAMEISPKSGNDSGSGAGSSAGGIGSKGKEEKIRRKSISVTAGGSPVKEGGVGVAQ